MRVLATTATCRCGTEFTYELRGQPRIWCSERCRKRISYSVPCERCGRPCGGIGTQGGGESVPRFCRGCAVAVAGEKSTARSAALRTDAERLWAEGRPVREIAAHFGWTPRATHTQISEWRAGGGNFPHRNPGCARANRGNTNNPYLKAKARAAA